MYTIPVPVRGLRSIADMDAAAGVMGLETGAIAATDGARSGRCMRCAILGLDKGEGTLDPPDIVRCLSVCVDDRLIELDTFLAEGARRLL